MEHLIKYYPVGNADCTLIKLDNGKTIIVDCQLLSNLKDEKGKVVNYDVKSDLLKELSKNVDGHPFVDLFISTHPHDDHCIGFSENFYQGNPKDYSDKENQQIIVGELWITPRGLSNDVCSSASAIRKEAKRRRKLYDDDANYVGAIGSYLRIVGYDKDREYDERYGYIPGEIVNGINGSSLEWLEIFIHAPFKEDIQESKEQNDKNASSIVVQFSFYTKGSTDSKCRVLMGGDAEHEIWQHILDNNQDDKNLEWNIFLAPHHCSWTFFNETSNKDEIKQSATDIMNMQIGDKAFVISSSKEISSEDSDPPCKLAKDKYIGFLKAKDNFRNTAVDYKENGVPQPIIFYIDEKGKRKLERIAGAGTSTYTRPALRAGEE